MKRLLWVLLLWVMYLGIPTGVFAQTPTARYYATYSVAIAAGLPGRVVSTPINMADLLQQAGGAGTVLPESIQAYLVTGTTVGEAIPTQFEASAAGSSSGTLYLYLPNLGATASTQQIRVYFDTQGTYAATNLPQGLKIEENITYQNAPSTRITGPLQIYIYDMVGAGMAALLDSQGNDWIGHSTAAAGDGMFRGIPNGIEPEGGFHAGDTTMTSTITHKGPVKVTIDATGYSGAWEGQFAFYPTHATFTITKAGHAYWLLYEGTPGGSFEPNSDYITRSDGTKTMASESWDGDIPAPEWALFSDGTLDRSLYMYLKDDDSTGDSFWPMGTQMTVFGIGRVNAPLIQKTPNTLAFGLLETRDYASAKTQLASVFVAPLATLEGVGSGGGDEPTTVPPTNPPSGCEKKALGDADCNGSVTLADFSRWRAEYFDATTKDSDFNSDGSVSLADYQIWRTTYVGAQP